MAQFFDAFISYGRADSKAFAAKLNQRLIEAGLDVWFDFEDIPLGVDYQNQIDDGIEHAHNFLFLIAPHSVNSPYCLKEIELAIARGKRIIPLLHVEKIDRATWQQRFPSGTDEDWTTYVEKGLHSSYPNMHPVISKINWVYCREGQDDFEVALSGLLDLLAHQQAYVHHHTWILDKALQWQRQQKRPHYLLVGEARIEAQNWLLTEFSQEQAPCTPTDLHGEYISESRKNANNLMTDVFLTYAEEDRDRMAHMRSLLWRAGLTVWTNTTDIQSGEDFNQAIERGIEAASNLVFLLSPESLTSTYCQRELEYAVSLHKRVIPVLLRPVAPDQLPLTLRDLHYIDGSQALDSSAATLRSLLLKTLYQDADYYENHKQFLTKALKWERQHRNPSILLRGYNLREGEAWLKVAQGRSHHTPTPLQVDLIEESLRQPPASSLDVFISYSRIDSGLARRVNDALQMQGKTTWFDQESIAVGSADFQREIYSGIETSDNFLFILSPTAIASAYCDDEVDYAAKLNKRIITILAQPIDTAQLHPELAKVQWLDFTATQGDFNAFFAQLIRTLETDREHVHSHTRWSQRSLEWAEKDRTEDLLLRGTELAIAQAWLQQTLEQAKKPVPTELQKDFIQASRALSDRLRQEEEARRQRELEQAQQLAQAAEAQRKAEAEARVMAEQRAEQEAKARKISQRITLMTAIGAPLLSVLVLATGVTWRASQIDAIETQAIEAEAYLRDNQPFDALVASTLAGVKLKRLWLFPPNRLQSQIDGALRQAEQDAREANRIEGDAPFLDVDLSPDERYLAMSSQSGAVIVWDLIQQQEKTTIPVSDSSIYQVQFTSDSQSLITIAENQDAQLWDLEGQLQQTYELPSGRAGLVGISPDGTWIAIANLDGTIFLLSKTGEVSQQFTTSSEGVTDLNISSDNRYLVASNYDGTAYLWNLENKTLKKAFHQDDVMAANFTPDGASILTATLGGTLRQWDLQGNELQRWQLDGTVIDIDGVEEGRTVAIAYSDGRVVTLDLDTSTQVELLGHQDFVNQVQISPGNQLLISASQDRTVRLWHSAETQGLRLAIPEDAIIDDIRLSASGGYALALHPDDTVKLWTLDEKLIATLNVPGVFRTSAFSPQQDLLATGTADGIVTLWNLQGQRIKEFQAHETEITSLEFSPDGKLVATASDDQTAILWDLQGQPQQELAGHEDWVYHVSFSPNGQLLATSSLDQTARLWSFRGELQHEFKDHEDSVVASAFSADGQFLATASTDRVVRIWHTETGALQSQLVGHQGAVTDVTFVNNTPYLVTTSEDGTARLWDFSGEEITQYKLYNTAIQLVKVSADGRFLATIAEDATTRLWRIDPFEQILASACQRIRPYLHQSSSIAEGDRRLCDRLAQPQDES